MNVLRRKGREGKRRKEGSAQCHGIDWGKIHGEREREQGSRDNGTRVLVGLGLGLDLRTDNMRPLLIRRGFISTTLKECDEKRRWKLSAELIDAACEEGGEP